MTAIKQLCFTDLSLTGHPLCRVWFNMDTRISKTDIMYFLRSDSLNIPDNALVLFQVSIFEKFWCNTFFPLSCYLETFGYGHKHNMSEHKEKCLIRFKQYAYIHIVCIHQYTRRRTHPHVCVLRLCVRERQAVWFVLKRTERNNGTKKQTLCSKCLISPHELVNLKEYDLQMCFSKSKLPGFCGGELISPSMTLDRKGLLLLLWCVGLC